MVTELVPMKRYGILMVSLMLLNCIITLYIVVNSHVYDTGQSLINDNFTVVSIVKSTFKE